MHFTQMPPLFTLTYPLTFPLLYNKDIIVNLYKLYFPSSTFSLKSNKKFFHPSNQTHIRENQIFSIPLLFHPPTNFLSSYFSTPPIKQTLNLSLWIDFFLNFHLLFFFNFFFQLLHLIIARNFFTLQLLNGIESIGIKTFDKIFYNC